MGDWKKKRSEREQRVVAVGSGCWGRLGSLSMESAHFFFNRRVQTTACGAMPVFAFEEYQNCEIQH